MMTRETDPALRRIERDTWVACAAMALAAFVVSGGRWDVSLGVVGGGLLAGVSYRAIKSGATALAAGAAGSREGATVPAWRRRVLVRAAVRFITRHALLAILAYAMIARLRLHPIGLLGGASSVALAAAAEAVRLLQGMRRAS